MLNVQRFFKKIISMNIAILLMISASKTNDRLVWAGNTDKPAQNQEDLSPKANPDSKEDIGPVLHAWCWKFNDVSRYINEISEAGYKGIQISPVQPEKPTHEIKAKQKKGFETWWSFYQPLGFEVGNYLGTENDFKHMCEQAHKVGIRIIVDVVANHLAEETGIDNYSEAITSNLKEIYENKELFYETGFEKYSEGNPPIIRKHFTECNSVGGPALNTKNKELQSVIREFLEKLIDLGTDGFRFDAAKHIELPEDEESLRSDFWPNVIGGLNDYYQSKGHENNLFIYGEVLSDNVNNIAGNCVENAYLKYLNITDDQIGSEIRSVLRKARYSNRPIESQEIIGYCRNRTLTDPGHFVTWIESHDNYANGYTKGSNEDNGVSTRDLTAEDIRLGWAMIASRNKSVPLYLARPLKKHEGVEDLNSLIGGPGDFYWADKTIREVNRFRSAMVGRKEYIIKLNNSVFVNLREGCGATIVNLSQQEQEINVNTKYLSEKYSFEGLNDGDFKDSISGKIFNVCNSVLTGSIAGRSVATLYLSGTYPFLNFTIGTTYANNLKVYFEKFDNCACSYSFDKNDGSSKQLSEDRIVNIGKWKAVGDETVLVVTGHTEKNGFTLESKQIYVYTKVKECKAIIKVRANGVDRCNLYEYTVSYIQDLYQNQSWPGLPLSKNGEDYFVQEIDSNKKIIVFYPGLSIQFPARFNPGIPVHLGEEVIIDGETVSVSDLKY